MTHLAKYFRQSLLTEGEKVYRGAMDNVNKAATASAWPMLSYCGPEDHPNRVLAAK